MINTKIETIFMNTENSKTNQPQRFKKYGISIYGIKYLLHMEEY